MWFEHRQPRVLGSGRKGHTRASHIGRTFQLQRSDHGDCDKREGEQIVTNVREIAQGGADSNDRAVGRPDTVLRTQNTREKTNPAHPEGRTGFERELIGGGVGTLFQTRSHRGESLQGCRVCAPKSTF